VKGGFAVVGGVVARVDGGEELGTAETVLRVASRVEDGVVIERNEDSLRLAGCVKQRLSNTWKVKDLAPWLGSKNVLGVVWRSRGIKGCSSET